MKILKANPDRIDPLGPMPKEVPPGLAQSLGRLAETDGQIADLVMPSVRRVVEQAELEQVQAKTNVPLITGHPQPEL